MWKTNKKNSLIVIVIVAVSMMLSACAQKDNSKQANATKSTFVSKEPIEITVFHYDDGNVPYDLNEREVVKELTKATNVSFKWWMSPSNSMEEKYNLMMASGEVADLVFFNRDPILKYAMQGAFEPLDDLINKDAPNLKKYLIDDNDVKKEITGLDGKMYTVPPLSESKTPAQVFLVRQDWLDKFGMKPPVTTDDWYNMLKTFKDKDANGNGKPDEIPFTSRSGRPNITTFVQAWGISEDFFIEDGVVKYGAVDPRMKDALTFINKLYKEKLIENEYLTIDKKQWDARLTNERSGALHDFYTRIDYLNMNVGAVNPSAKFIAVPPPKGPTGISTTRRCLSKVDVVSNGAISTKSKYKTEIIKLLDFMYSDDYTMMWNLGLEGKHYTKNANGGIVFTDEVMKNPSNKTPQEILWSLNITNSPHRNIALGNNALFSKAVNDASKMYIPILSDPYPSLIFSDDELDSIKTKTMEVKTYCDEMMDKFIMGVEPLGKFDDFVTRVKAIGIEDILRVNQKAYDRYKNN